MYSVLRCRKKRVMNEKRVNEKQWKGEKGLRVYTVIVFALTKKKEKRNEINSERQGRKTIR